MCRFLLVFTLAAMPWFSHATEEPDCELIRKIDNVELRQYAPCVVAEVVLNTPAEAAGSQAFPVLASDIFGKTRARRS